MEENETNAIVPETTEVVEETAVTEAAAPEESVEASAEAPQEDALESSQEDINIEDYVKERYPVSGHENRDLVAEVSQELAQLPTDESGTVETDAAARWFAERMAAVEHSAVRAAERAAQQASMGVVSEATQQRQLMEKYPDMKKDRDTLDAVFDLRDAAALRGQNISLMEAAAKLDNLRRNSEQKGASQRTTTIQATAAAHLETSAVKGDPKADARTQTVRTALEGRGQEAVDARRALLKQFVENEVKAGNIQP